MMGRLAAGAALLALAACANVESAGRTAAREAAPTTVAAPAPTVSAPAPAPTPAPEPQVAQAEELAAPGVAAPPAPQTTRRASDSDDDIVVPGQVERQVPAPRGDPRSTSERMADIRAWDRCVMQLQDASDGDPMRPQLTTPEEHCSSSLGMASRTAVPESRRR